MTPRPIPFVRWTPPAPGECLAVSPLMRRVLANNPGPFTYSGTGTYIVGAGEVAVIDPGPPLADHLEALLTAVTGERVTHILVTHNHRDHSPLAAELAARTGAIVLAAAPPALTAGGEPGQEEGFDAGFSPDRTLEDGEIIEGRGWTLRSVFTPGHTSSHMCFALQEEKALLCGDHVMGWSTTVISPPDGDMEAYLESLRKVADERFTTLWPTHGPPITDPAPFLEAYLEHRRSREAEIIAAIAAGRSQIADMVPLIYAAVDARLWPAASHSVLAHLIGLVRRGAVRCDSEPAMGGVYSLS